jgi:hypothetical protein
MSLLKPSKKRKVDHEAMSSKNSGLRSHFLCKKKIRLCVSCVRTVYQFSKSVTLSGTTLRIKKYDVFQGQASICRELFQTSRIYSSRVNENLAVVRASFHVAEIIAQKGRPFTGGEFVKRCFMSMTGELFPEKKKCVSGVSLSACTVTRRIDDIGDFTLSCLKNKCQSFTKFSLALDESTDTCDTAQLLIFVQGIEAEFEIAEELARLQSLK